MSGPVIADGDDRTLFPVLSERQVQAIVDAGEVRRFAPGQVLFDQGDRDVPLFFLQSGAVQLVDHRPEGDRRYASVLSGTFLGDTAIFTGEPAIAACVAVDDVEAVEVQRDALRRLLATHEDLAEVMLGTFSRRRSWLSEHGFGQLRLVATRSDERHALLRELLQRNQVPFTYVEAGDPPDPDILDRFGLAAEDLPAVVEGLDVHRSQDITSIADWLGLHKHLLDLPAVEVDEDLPLFDVVVVGAGPAGLSATVYASSEGLRTLVVDAFAPGGQVARTGRIENYLGFPSGLSGTELGRRATLQARRFGAVMSNPHEVQSLVLSVGTTERGALPRKRLQLADGQEVLARTVVIATGVEYRRLPVPGADQLDGNGLFHWATNAEALRCADADVVVVGAGNSAGQAAVQLARYARHVTLVFRRPILDPTMSAYLADRIRESPVIELVGEHEVAGLTADDRGQLSGIDIRDRRTGDEHHLDCAAVFALIGGEPRSRWLDETVATDPRGLVLTGEDAAAVRGLRRRAEGRYRRPLPLETTMPGVFAVGDVRRGSTPRVAAAIGDGALAIRQLLGMLTEMGSLARSG